MPFRGLIARADGAMPDECIGLFLFKDLRASIIKHEAQALILYWRGRN